MKYPAYPKYKDSGVQWLGEVPEHWEVLELRRFIRFITSGSRGWAEYYADEGKIFVRIGNLTRHSINVDLSDIQYVAPPAGAEGERTVIFKGDVLFSITAYIGSVAVATEQIVGAYINQHIALVRLFVGKVFPRYIAYATLSDSGQAQLGGQGYGGTKVQLALDDVKSFRVPVPPLPEQTAIADFLDRETGRIDTLVAKKRRLIALLGEKRTALISRTVTRGLPADAAREFGLEPHTGFKDSGIEWLGVVPEVWEVVKFSREVKIAEGQVDPEHEPYSTMVLIGPEHVEAGTGRLVREATAEDQAAISGKYYCHKGEVIYSKIRPALRKVVKAKNDCLCSADMYPLGGKDKLLNDYIYWFFLSDQFAAWSVLEADRVAMPKINRNTLNELRLPVPVGSEQTAIATYLDRETATIDQLVAKVEAAIVRLLEYRTALITAAVTGKIDVRGEGGQTGTNTDGSD